MKAPKNRHPHYKEIIEYWASLPEPKPSLKDFAVLCENQGWKINTNLLKQWRFQGIIPGELTLTPGRGSTKKLGTASVVAGIIRKAKNDAGLAAKDNSTFSKTMVREVCAKTMRCAEAFVDRITTEVVNVKVDNAADLAILAGVGMQVMGQASQITEALKLLMVTEAIEDDKETNKPDSGPISLDARRSQLASRLGVAKKGDGAG